MKISVFWELLLSVFLIFSFIISFVVNWLFMRFTLTLGSKNQVNNELRWATDVKPAIGGISFFIIFLISISIVGALPRGVEYDFDIRLIGLTISSTLGFIIGLSDDAFNTNPLLKLIGQISCAFILILSGVYIDFSGNYAIDYGLTAFWVVGVMNAVNLLDNIDGAAGSVSATIIFGICVVIFLENILSENYYLVMMLGVLGALLGFLYFNWQPAKLYMGDTGSQFLGIFLAGCGIIFLWDYKSTTNEFIQIKQFVIPILYFIVPIIDTATVTIRRVLRGQSPFVGGKDHITHHLIYLGLSERQVSSLLSSISLLSIPFSMPVILKRVEWTIWVTLGYVAYIILLFVLFQILYDMGAKKKLKMENEKGSNI